MGAVELTPPFVSKLVESVAHSASDRASAELPALADATRLPLFRQSRSDTVEGSLAEDCKRLHLARGEEMVTEQGERIGPDHLLRLETAFQARSHQYKPGHYLSLVRLGLDLLETERSGLTVLEKRSLHLFERRLFEMQRAERPAPWERSAGWLSDFHSGDGWKLRGLADLMRYVDEVTGHPLIGFPDQATSDVVHLLLALHGTFRTLVPDPSGPLGTTPLDLCLGARSVLTNAKFLQLRLGSLQDLVLSPELALWRPLEDWLSQIHHSREATFRLPADDAVPDFLVEGKRLRAFDLVWTVGHRLENGVRRLSLDESLVALERTLHRRIHRQEARKRHMGSLLRNAFDRTLNECHKRSMRTLRHPAGPTTPPEVGDARSVQGRSPKPHRESPPGADADADLSWARLRAWAEELEECRIWGCSVSSKVAWIRLFPERSARPEELSDLDEFLRWALDCRGELAASLDRIPLTAHSALRSWFLYLADRAASVEIPRKKSGAQRRRERATPLQWYAAALAISPERILDPAHLKSDPTSFAPFAADARIGPALLSWIHRHPWDRTLCGIWPPDLRGPSLRDGVRVGVLRCEKEGVPPWELGVRLGMLSRELEYRCWLGAGERFALLARTLDVVDSPA